MASWNTRYSGKVHMAGIEGGPSGAVATAVNTAPSIGVNAAPLGSAVGEAHFSGFATLSGDGAPTVTDTFSPAVGNPFVGLSAYSPTHDMGAMGFDVAPVAHAEVSPSGAMSVVEQAVNVVASTEQADQAQQIAAYLGLYGLSVPAQEVSTPAASEIPTDIHIPEFTSPVAEVVSLPEQPVVEAIAEEVISEVVTPEEIGRQADVELAAHVEEMARELGLEQVVEEMAAIQEPEVLGEDIPGEVVQDRDVLVEAEPMALEQHAPEIEIPGVTEQTIPEAEALPVSTDGETEDDAQHVVSEYMAPTEAVEEVEKEQDEVSTNELMRENTNRKEKKVPPEQVEKLGPRRAEKEISERRTIATTVVGAVAKEVGKEESVDGTSVADRVEKEIANKAISPIAKGAVDHTGELIANSVRGRRNIGHNAAVSALLHGIQEHPAVEWGRNPNLGMDAVEKVLRRRAA